MYGYYSLGDVMNSWANQGVFAYGLPFLLIFAIVFGVLSKSKILGENKGVQATIALAVGLLALQFNLVTDFYATIFPYAGIAIAILVVAIILMGLMFQELNWSKYVFFGIGAILFIVVLFTSLADFSYFGGWGYGWADSWPAIMAGLIFLGIMGWVIFSGKN